MGQFREHQVLRERSWLACESGGPTLEILLNFMNADRRLDARNISLHRTETQVVDFKNREHIPDFLRSVRNSDVFITQAFTQGEFWDEDPAKSIMLADPSRLDREIVDLQWTIGSVRGCHAKSISLDLGFFPYGRSDKKFKGGQYIIAKSFLEALDAQAGIRADTIVTYDLHNEAIAGFPNSFGMDPLSAEMLFAIYFRNLQEIKGRPLVVVSPDSGGAKRAERLSLFLGTDLAIGYKSRKQGEEAKLKKIIGEIRKGSIAVVFDDMIDGGGTAKPVAEMLYKMAPSRFISRSRMACSASQRGSRLLKICSANTISKWFARILSPDRRNIWRRTRIGSRWSRSPATRAISCWRHTLVIP